MENLELHKFPYVKSVEKSLKEIVDKTGTLRKLPESEVHCKALRPIII